MSGDPREALIEHLNAMRAFALTLTQDRALAEDVVQDAVIKAWMNFDQFQPGSNLRAWLLTILRNTFYSEMRRRRLDTEELTTDGTEKASVEPTHDGVLQMRDFLRAFRHLSLEHREALLLVGAMGFSYEEAAKMADVPVGTIKSRLTRARRRLAVQFDPRLRLERSE